MENSIPENGNTVKISAKSGEGLDRLLDAIARNLPESAKRMKLLFPYDKAGLIADIRRLGKVFSEEYTENGIAVDGLVDIKLVKEMSKYAE